MSKKDRFYALSFIFAIISIITAIILKILGCSWFTICDYKLDYFYYVESAVKFLILLAQYILIVGCVTKYPPRELMTKMLPYLPLTFALYFFPQKHYVLMCFVVMFSTCVSLMPKFSTIIRLIVNVFFICVIQLAIIYLRLDLKQIAPAFPDELQFLILNIDQFVILTLLYYVNRKEMIAWVGSFLANRIKRHS